MSFSDPSFGAADSSLWKAQICCNGGQKLKAKKVPPFPLYLCISSLLRLA
jgi:hypothetical protein